ncbi:bifunctional folylpolyglutamate synthase/dihydrofolate synthase [Pedobacter cryotolerans]|uniref:Dihydrofolate synthase/folylpolyglutamate synthase n=1 Tax=Pedobacter cryotolerans TaxID=2571270 RepID=A0A4U1C3K4_9SPHI|nr:folylpolyglutamate synthase/dihydrofolate synthase family protein [Pedobacter cryotolerans]TKB99786.1 bifunctional folylpolyglutamate synthase/dihydrofolate synthase [Pedobacter cryotolerans]
MTYQQTLNFLYSKLPMFTRIGAAALKKDLHNTIELCARLDNPQHQFKTIHIAGTNGKGSTSHMLAAILQKSGYKTGLYTSPHLKDFRERIRINGKMVPKAFVKDFVRKQKKNILEIEPSFFEVTVAMAFEYFAKEKVDIAVIEVGLGGRLDSTNIITPELSVITNISLDHTNLLGDTLAQIAFEKAGIIKPNIPVVIGEKHIETIDVFKQKAKLEKAPIHFAEDTLKINHQTTKGSFLTVDILENEQAIFTNLALDLTGTYQQKNILTVIQSVLKLRELGFNIPDRAIYQALKNVKKLTGLQGRWQTLSKSPLVICDTGHNKAGITEILKNIANIKYQTLHMVIGMVKDKDIDGVLALLPNNAIYYFCQPDLERALPAQELYQKATLHNLKGKVFNSVIEAFKYAKEKSHPKDLIFIGGSTFVVAEIL